MSEVNYEKLRKSLAHLRKGHEAWLECPNRPELLDSDREAFKESLTKRFDICFQMAWRHLQKHLKNQGVVDVARNPKNLFRMGAENYLLEDAEQWFIYTDAHSEMIREYDEVKVNEAIGLIPDFIEDAIDLYEEMTGEEWNRR